MTKREQAPRAISGKVTKGTRIQTRTIKRASTEEGRGWLRLCEILESAKGDELIKTSGPARDFLDLVYEVAADSLFCGTADEAIKPLIHVIDSDRNSEKSRKSHKGRRTTREHAENLFMSGGPWHSMQDAIDSIRADVLLEAKKHSRPLSKYRANKTLREWLTKLVRENPVALSRLTPEARRRLKL